MRVFQIKGFSGLFMFFLAVVGLISVLVLLPTAFVMVLWNATVFEGFNGPEIDMFQAVILWAAVLVLTQAFMRPQVSFQFKNISDPAELERQLRELKKSDSEK
jgi:hypothetical protein